MQKRSNFDNFAQFTSYVSLWGLSDMLGAKPPNPCLETPLSSSHLVGQQAWSFGRCHRKRPSGFIVGRRLWSVALFMRHFGECRPRCNRCWPFASDSQHQ